MFVKCQAAFELSEDRAAYEIFLEYEGIDESEEGAEAFRDCYAGTWDVRLFTERFEGNAGRYSKRFWLCLGQGSKRREVPKGDPLKRARSCITEYLIWAVSGEEEPEAISAEAFAGFNPGIGAECSKKSLRIRPICQM
ncbi:hypothetical protein LJC15_01155 [Desulfovibrio sp. OttesenSCG-928-G11]|nr:hypothetical protein [Desulfovibrio sp. OttesenSCG-928-G11]